MALYISNSINKISNTVKIKKNQVLTDSASMSVHTRCIGKSQEKTEAPGFIYKLHSISSLKKIDLLQTQMNADFTVVSCNLKKVSKALRGL